MEEVDPIRKMLAFIDSAAALEALKMPPNYGPDELAGDRAGTGSMSVTRDWSLTFRFNEAGEQIDMDLEDYHGS